MEPKTVKVTCTKCEGQRYLNGDQYEGHKGQPKACYACHRTGVQEEIPGAPDAVPGSVVTIHRGEWHYTFKALSERVVTLHSYVDSIECGVSPAKVTWHPVGMSRWLFKKLIDQGYKIK